jgi:NADPH:quinone reductase-like Zn-dependent oxidoreductase
MDDFNTKENTMKAVRIHKYGDRSVLRYEECPVPPVAEDEVLIKVIATSVNPIDWKVRTGHLKEKVPHQFPMILGWDVAGIIQEIGGAVTRFAPGDAVYTRPDATRNGSYAESIPVKESEVAFKPETISFMEAASLPLASITAWSSVIDRGEIQAGQSILIHAGSGGVGSIAVQLAKWKGAHVISTTSAANVDLVKSLGADEVIDYRSTNFQDVVQDVDIVFDTIGGQVQDDSWSVIKPGGRLVSVVEPPSESRAEQTGVRGSFVRIQPNASILYQLAKLVDDGVVRPIVGAEFALKNIQAAHALSESGHAQGKIVIHVGMP